MRKLKLQMQVSVDGFVAGPKGELEWMVWDWDDELKNHVLKLHEPVDQILLGAKMAEGFVDAWTERARNPETADWFTNKMLDTPKLVFSRSGRIIERENTQMNEGDLVEVITNLKNRDGNDIMAYGGAGFVNSLVKNNLIDDYHFFINPVVIGKGMTIFAGLDGKLKLKFIGTRSFECGIVGLHYQPQNS